MKEKYTYVVYYKVIKTKTIVKVFQLQIHKLKSNLSHSTKNYQTK